MLISEVLIDIGGRRLFHRDRADYGSRPGHAVASRKDPLRILLDPRVFRKFSKIDALPDRKQGPIRRAALLRSL